MRFYRVVAGLILTGAALSDPSRAIDKPTGNPLVMSEIETEQPIPLAYLSPDGRKAGCTRIKLHWSPSPSTSADDAATLALDIPPDHPGAATFTAQFWNASFSGSLAWQKPWQGAHWSVKDTPDTDGTGIDAGLAVGMVATSARRPYPKDTLVIGNLHPDSSLGKVSRLAERIDAAAQAGITRVIIPKVQEFEKDAAGNTINITRHAADLNVKCIPVDNIVEAIEVVMNDPLPDPPTGSGPPKYSQEIASYIDGFAQREQTEAASALTYAPKEAQLSQYPPRQAAIWKRVYAEMRQGQEAYKSGQVYAAYRLLARANSRMHGLNVLGQSQPPTFDVKAALEASQQLRVQLHYLMTPPPIDRGELESAMLIAEMADWAYDIQSLIEGSQLVTKQAFSQRSDSTAAERDRAREAILSANEEARYLLQGASFFTGLLPLLGEPNPMPANTNAMNLLPQLIPAQLAAAQIFTDGMRPHADEMRVSLLFDQRLAAYVNVLHEEKMKWDSSQRRRANAPAVNPATNDAATNTAPASRSADSTNTATAGTNVAPDHATPLVATNGGAAGFDPGTSYGPPRTEVEVSATEGETGTQKKLSDVAQCLIWVNTDCEIALLDQKYLRLDASFDPTTHDWHLKDRGSLDALLQLGEAGALQGAAFAQQAQVNSAVFGMILERATYLREHGGDENGLEGLRNFWRCALLGNMCWQLAHTHKAAVVDLSAEEGDKKGKPKKGKKPDETAASTNAPSEQPATTNIVATPATNPAPERPKPAEDKVAHDASKVEPTEPAPNIVDVPPVPPLDGSIAAVDTNGPPITPAADVVRGAPVIAPADTNAAPAVPKYRRAQAVTLGPDGNPVDTPAPAPAPAKDDEYTGGDATPAPPVAPAVGTPSTNAPPSVP